MLLEHATDSNLLAPETLAALSGEALIARIGDALTEIERTLIPDGLHVLGRSMTPSARREILAALATSLGGTEITDAVIDSLIEGISAETLAKRHRLRTQSAACLESLEKTNAMLADNRELAALVHALDGGFVPPAPGGDLIRTPEVLPSGRNIHGFDPFRLPSRYALAAGAKDAAALLERSIADGHGYPESVAVVLWGTDNLKSEGASIALALALMGVQPRFDEYGRLTGTELIPLSELGRPRIDVVMTVSGIFRDLLPLQTRLLADAAWLAATAEEDPEQNFVRRHALAEQQSGDCDIETAALRVFGNATGAYGANVNHLVENANWNEESELAETFGARKSFAYSRSGDVTEQRQHLTTLLGDVTLAYQNVESAELGVTALDQYFDTLGGLSRMASTQNGGATLPVYIGDQSRSETKLRSLEEQIALESHTRLLNDKWYEPLLRHGYEGVRQIQEHVRNTVGWSATTEQVQPWIYERVSKTYMLDEQMRRRLAELNPAASVQMATRLLEAHERNYWTADEQTLAALREAQDELEDRLEGIKVEVAA
jgi:magnesium chelatase subunit H